MFSGREQIQFFQKILFTHLGKDVPVTSMEFVSGGCINNAVKLITQEDVFFVKWNVHELEGMFESESKGLELLRETKEIAIPEVFATGKSEDKAYILMEFVSGSTPDALFWENFGHSLARLHRHTHATFGLDYDNYIGSLPQKNEKLSDGLTFFIENRLKVQSSLAFYQGEIDQNLLKQINLFCEKLKDLLPAEKPALLHGDLWSGNFLVDQRGQATLVDPAVYYGWREAELAYTKLFGGFDTRFYTAYHEEFPLEKGFEERVEIYNLYPLLVHLNVFGSSYRGMIERIIHKYLN